VPATVKEIRLEQVSFRYAGARTPVLDGLDLVIPPGRTTAIVGANGAGKTTLVKLLSRLYAPTTGAILADGTDIGRFPVQDWRRRIGVVFQDYLRYEASVADNIGFGAIEHLDDREGIRAAARDASLLPIVDRLPNGMATPLARHMTGGVDLSGGQWQRVAIARALFAVRHGASILILDEPTASLDVRAEARFYREFVRLVGDVTTVLISHRFSTVRLADNIVVLSDGRVHEQGTHEQLLAAGGRYAELFRLQAMRFTEDDTDDDQDDRREEPA
jgi:ATP-binding cassette subfamily B protein